MTYGSKRKDKNRIVLRPGESERPNGTYCYRWTDLDGKRRSVYAKTLAQLRDKEQHCEEMPPKQITIAEQFDEWFKSRRDLKQSTANLYNIAYTTYIKNRIGDMRICQTRRSDIRRFVIDLSKEYDLSTSRIKCVFSILSQIFSMAVDDQTIQINPCSNVLQPLLKRFKSEEKRHALTQKEQKQFLNFVQTSARFNRWYNLFAVLCDTGMRIGQALSLTWKDVNLAERYIDINKDVVYINHQHVVQKPKTQESFRHIPLTQRAFDILTKMKPNALSNLVFPNKFGAYLITTNLNKTLQYVVNAYNKKHSEFQLPHITCHIFRHTYATKLNRCGVNIKCCQRVLGHSKIDTTMNVYTDISYDMITSQIKKLTPSDVHF